MTKIQIDTPRFTFIKRKDDGTIDYISPFPCPFNYGSILDTTSEDGDRIDAVVLGKKVGFGAVTSGELRGVVNFVDKGSIDPKYIFSHRAVTKFEKLQIYLFFHFFSLVKKVYNLVRGRRGFTGLRSIGYFLPEVIEF